MKKQTTTIILCLSLTMVGLIGMIYYQNNQIVELKELVTELEDYYFQFD